MNEYKPDDFYETEHLSLEEKEYLCREAKEISYNWWVDCKIGIHREKINIKFDDVIKKIYKNNFNHFFFIHRKGIKNWFLEIGFMSGNYYLWINVEDDNLMHFIEKFKLKLLS